MNSFSECNFLSGSFSDRYFFKLDSIFEILPHFIILLDVLFCKHRVLLTFFSFLILLCYLLDNFVTIFVLSLVLLNCFLFGFFLFEKG